MAENYNETRDLMEELRWQSGHLYSRKTFTQLDAEYIRWLAQASYEMITSLRKDLDDIRKNCVELDRDYWLDRFDIFTRDWHDEDGTVMKQSFVIKKKEKEEVA